MGIVGTRDTARHLECLGTYMANPDRIHERYWRIVGMLGGIGTEVLRMRDVTGTGVDEARTIAAEHQFIAPFQEAVPLRALPGSGAYPTHRASHREYWERAFDPGKAETPLVKTHLAVLYNTLEVPTLQIWDMLPGGSDVPGTILTHLSQFGFSAPDGR